jgi:hypothetical protein
VLLIEHDGQKTFRAGCVPVDPERRAAVIAACVVGGVESVDRLTYEVKTSGKSGARYAMCGK